MLPPPVRYFPIERNRYDVSPGLRTFGTDFGQGPLDGHVFQLDAEFGRYRKAKLEARAERLNKYWVRGDCPPEVMRAMAGFLVQRLAHESPQWFRVENTPQGSTLHCELTHEDLHLDSQLNLIQASSTAQPAYQDTLDALACQVQEDLAIVVNEGGKDSVAALHLCFPNHWSAEEKLGRDFRVVHAPVAGFGPVSARSAELMDAVVRKGPYVRFAWGISSDERLNHHPEAPPGISQDHWKGRAFSGAPGESLFLRVERQVLWGFPEVSALLFTIRTSFLSLAQLGNEPGRRASLLAALHSMTPEQRQYKGLSQTFDAVVRSLA